MSSITKLNWNELDGTVADVNDIKPIADKVDASLDVLNPLDDEVVAARDGEDSLLDKITVLKNDIVSNDSDISTLQSTTSDHETRITTNKNNISDHETRITTNESEITNIREALETQVNYQGEWNDADPNKQATLGELWKYNGKFWVCLVSSTTTDPLVTSNDWGLWDNISDYVLDEPTVTTSDINENSTGTHTISNYDSTCSYSVSSNDSLISSISVSGDTITITTGNITNGVNNTATYTVTVSKAGYLLSQEIVTFTVVYVPIVADDALLWEGTTYISDNFDVVEGGSIA